MTKLDNKVVIITGAAQGMGEAHARLFVAEGAKVVITDLNEEKGLALEKEFEGQVLFIKHDVSDEQMWDDVVAKTLETFGKIDILVNNAGISIAGSMFDLSAERYDLIYRINQRSVFLGMKAVARVMKEQQSGSIVNISSINGIVGGAIGYTDTKFAVRGMTKAAALELSPNNIRVNSVHPGVIETPMISQGDNAEAVKAFSKQIPMRRIAQVEEVSKAVLFLASDDASYSTGSEIIIDGGLTAK